MTTAAQIGAHPKEAEGIAPRREAGWRRPRFHRLRTSFGPVLQGKGSAGRVLEHLVAEATHQDAAIAATVTEPTSLPGTSRVGACRTFRYVVVDVFTDTPLAGNQLAVFTDAREIPEEQLQQLAREINFSETVFVYPAEGEAHAKIRIFTPDAEVPFAGHPTLGTAFVLGGPLQLERDPARDRARRRAGPARARGCADRLRADGAADPDDRAVRGRAAALGARRRALRAAGRGLRQRPAARVRRARLGGRGRGAASRTSRASPSSTRLLGVNTIAGSGTRWKTRMFAPPAASPRTLRPARRPGRSRCISPATAGSLSATRSRSHRASRSGGRRRSTRAWTAARQIERVEVGGSRWSSPAASSGCSRFSLISERHRRQAPIGCPWESSCRTSASRSISGSSRRGRARTGRRPRER